MFVVEAMSLKRLLLILHSARFFESGMRYCIPEHPGNFPLTRHIVPRATYSEDEETGWPDWYSSSTPLKHSELL
eukprot:m.268285 g.268285  ORF g.268285 m.268285 type:complete len:74 (+) comp15655_c0_seq2:1341-1562(+)